MGDGTNGASSRAQVTEDDVAEKVAKLSNDKERQGTQNNSQARCLIGGAIEEVTHQEARQDPIVTTVLEEISERHGGLAETMHKETLIFSLGKVEGDTGVSQTRIPLG